VLLMMVVSTTIPAEDRTSSTLRIVTLSPSLTETVFALGADSQLVAVSDFCQWPPEAQSLPTAGGLYNLNTERLIALQPDLVLHTAMHDGGIEKLRGADITTKHVPVENVADALTTIRSLGALLGRESKAAALQASVEQQLAQVRSHAQQLDLPKQRVLYVVGHPPGVLRDVYVVGSNNFLDELITAAGARNVMKDSPVRYPIASKEALIASPPDVIIESGKHDHDITKQLWSDLLALDEATGPRVVFLDDPHLAIPGPSVGESAAKLQRLIYGEDAFKP